MLNVGNMLDDTFPLNRIPLGIKIFIFLLTPFLLTYLTTWLRGSIAAKRKGSGKTPPLIPYATPLLGSLFSFAFDTCHFIDVNSKRFGQYVPVSIRILNRKLHLISGRENTLALFKNSRDTTTAPSSIIVLENLFGSPSSKRYIYERDDTGIQAEPLPGSRPLPLHNRIYYNVHKTVHTSLSGPGLAHLAEDFVKNLRVEIEQDRSIGFEEWVEIPDFYSFVRDKVFNASTSALCGPHILRLNPTFTADFWKFDSFAPKLFKALPRWMIPKAFKVRDSLHEQVKKWHRFANMHVDVNSKELADVQFEEYFGAKIMRERQQLFKGIDGYGEDAAAANDLGMLWGANANVVPLIGFSLLDILCRPDVEARVRNEIASINDASHGGLTVDVAKLLVNPLLQSIYSEELRLRNAVMIQRSTISAVTIGGYSFPKGDMIVASSWHEARDRNIWNEGKEGDFHSVEDFWSERFIVDPNDPTSGPGKAPPIAGKKARASTQSADRKPYFSAEPVSGSFIPYGGGQKICPGRFYAKQEAISSVALFLMAYDIEIDMSGGVGLPMPNMEFFPFGVVQPSRVFKARVKRRRV